MQVIDANDKVLWEHKFSRTEDPNPFWTDDGTSPFQQAFGSPLPAYYIVSGAGYGRANGVYELGARNANTPLVNETQDAQMMLPYVWQNCETGSTIWCLRSECQTWFISEGGERRYFGRDGTVLPPKIFKVAEPSCELSSQSCAVLEPMSARAFRAVEVGRLEAEKRLLMLALEMSKAS